MIFVNLTIRTPGTYSCITDRPGVLGARDYGAGEVGPFPLPYARDLVAKGVAEPADELAAQFLASPPARPRALPEWTAGNWPGLKRARQITGH